MPWNEQEIQQTMVEVQRRASADATFRALVLRDPKAAIARVNPKPIPDDVAVRVVDNGGRLTLTLPDSSRDRELSDEELDLVSGGGGLLGSKVAHNVNANLTTES